MDSVAAEVIQRTYEELKCGARTLAPPFEFEQTLALAGFVIVPKEPTPTMVDAGARANGFYEAKYKSIYRAMIGNP
ncbi:MAG: hypothetical protein EPO08_21425 [Rhodospirillaceae bacterium]|nr:MAG: hypothetical protein EPO08_21425 [Rhodospirillaceae bacterium]